MLKGIIKKSSYIVNNESRAARVLAIILIIGFLIFPDKVGYVSNVIITAIGLAVTYLIIDRLLRKQLKDAEEKLKRQHLPRRASSRAHSIAISAIEELTDNDWLLVEIDGKGILETGPMPGANLALASLKKVKLRHIDLTGATFIKAELEGADFSEATLNKAKFNRANLKDCVFNGTEITGCQFKHAILVNAKLCGIKKANKLAPPDVEDTTDSNATLIPNKELEKPPCFQYAIMVGAIFKERASDPETDISYVDFSHAKLYRAKMFNVNASSTNFEFAYLCGADLTDAKLHNAKMTNAHLTPLVTPKGKEVTLLKADLTLADLSHAKADEADFTDATLDGVNLQGAFVSHAKFIGADFRCKTQNNVADLSDITAEYTDFTNAHLEDANLRDAHLKGANFKDAYLFGVNFKGADLAGADFGHAHGTNSAYFDETTIFPDGTPWRPGRTLTIFVIGDEKPIASDLFRTSYFDLGSGDE